MVQINFLDNSIVGNLVPIKTMKPQTVYFVIDSRLASSNKLQNVENAVKRWKTVKKIEFVPVNILDIEDIRAKLTQIIERHRDIIYMDMTAGSTLAAAAAFGLCDGEHVIPVYADIIKERIYNVKTGAPMMMVEHITLDDYLTAVSARRLKGFHQTPAEKDFGKICEMAKYVENHLDEWHALQLYASKRFAATQGLEIDIPYKNQYNNRQYDCEDLIKKFVEYGFITHVGGNRYKVADEDSKGYLTIFGIWLEMYVYIKARSCYSEASMGLIIDWNSGDGVDSTDNEIDVVAMHKSTLIFISCKMRKPDPYDIYEVGYLAKRLGGSDARSAIATTYPVRRNKNGTLYQRFKKMKVGVIEMDDFDNRRPAEVFNRSMQSLN